MKLVMLFAVSVLLAGCMVNLDVAGTDWGKPGAPINQVTLDELECARASSDNTVRPPDLLVGGLVDVARIAIQEGAARSSYNGCMRAKGYAPTS
jgi:hypothetical protein